MARAIVNLEGDHRLIEEIERRLLSEYGRRLTIEVDWTDTSY